MKKKKNRCTVIGLCGRSGSGKGYISSVFASFGGLHIDTDKVYHDLLEPVDGKISECLSEIVSYFGEGILDGLHLDRKKLGAIVFSDDEKLLKLNEITHKYIKEKTLSLIDSCTATFAVVDAPVLFESGFDSLCDFTVCAVADDETCIKRIVKRDGVTEEAARARLANQISCEELEAKCDFAVDNSYGRDVTEQIEKILKAKGLVRNEH